LAALKYRVLFLFGSFDRDGRTKALDRPKAKMIRAARMSE